MNTKSDRTKITDAEIEGLIVNDIQSAYNQTHVPSSSSIIISSSHPLSNASSEEEKRKLLYLSVEDSYARAVLASWNLHCTLLMHDKERFDSTFGPVLNGALRTLQCFILLIKCLD